MSHTVYLALGTNISDRAANFAEALQILRSFLVIVDLSPVYETPPWGFEDQPPFLNMVVRVETDLSPDELMTRLKRIEHQMGRTPTVRFGPRLIDLDLLFYDDLVVEQDRLEIPHPRLRGRAFVLVPLSDIAPDLVHPVFKIPVVDLLAEVNTDGITEYPFELDRYKTSADDETSGKMGEF